MRVSDEKTHELLGKILLLNGEILAELRDIHRTLRGIEYISAQTFYEVQAIKRIILHPPSPNVTQFTPIKEITMVPLAAGQTATFSTTPIPSTSVPTASGIVWSSSDSVNAPVSPNSADATGLSTLVVFPSTVAAGVTFSLTVTYTNADGTVATQTNSFTTVAPPVTDVTGFSDIVQSA